MLNVDPLMLFHKELCDKIPEANEADVNQTYGLVIRDYSRHPYGLTYDLPLSLTLIRMEFAIELTIGNYR